MFSFKRWFGCVAIAAGSALAQTPALTTIQDVLYTADGNRFAGMATITWKNFEASDTTNVVPQVNRLLIVNGILYVQLIPTTNANSPASYMVQYNAAGKIQFTEYWLVPPSTTPLRVRDVRLGSGGVTTPGGSNGGTGGSTTVQISDVTGLQSALNQRLPMGTGFTASRAAVINALGAVDGAAGNLTDCVHVDGSSGPCGNGSGGGTSATFVDAETPSGAMNGSNNTFTLANPPNPSASLALFRNGMLLRPNVDYALSTRSVTFYTGTLPQSGDSLVASYRLAVSLPGVGFVDGETPAGALNGVNNVFTLSQIPNPAASVAVFRNGVFQKLGTDYNVNNNTITFLAGSIPQAGDILLSSYRIAQ